MASKQTSMDDNCNELKLKHLFKVWAKANVPEKIKSVTGILGKIISDNDQLLVPHEFKNSRKVCQHCCTLRNAANTVYKIVPSKRSSASIQRIISKKKKGKTLSKIEKRLLERASTGNTLVIKCLMCHKAEKVLVKKRECDVVIEPVHDMEDMGNCTSKKMKKKKKKKRSYVLNFSDNNVLSPLETSISQSYIGTPVPNTPIYNVTKRLFKSNTNSSQSNSTADFISLESTPRVEKIQKTPRNKDIRRNPFGEKSKEAKDKKRLSSLQKILQMDSNVKPTSLSPRLKDFLSEI